LKNCGRLPNAEKRSFSVMSAIAQCLTFALLFFNGKKRLLKIRWFSPPSF
jgi:hypothetical protein